MLFLNNYKLGTAEKLMMTAIEIMLELTKLGSEQTKKAFINHGAPPDTTYGVKVGDLEIIQKKNKKKLQISIRVVRYKNFGCDVFSWFNC